MGLFDHFAALMAINLWLIDQFPQFNSFIHPVLIILPIKYQVLL